MDETVAEAVTTSSKRKSLYHFTRTSNLPAMAYFDSLFSSNLLHGNSTGERRQKRIKVQYRNYEATLNGHLRIPDEMLAETTTQEEFRACLDQHVFFWPTLKDCLKMLDTYTRREPEEPFAVLEFDAQSLLLAHFSAVKLSKYDSGSAPRFPHLCSYRKSPEMFLPLAFFKQVHSGLVPANISEIKEVLVENEVNHMTKHLKAIYHHDEVAVPLKWKAFSIPIRLLRTANQSL